MLCPQAVDKDANYAALTSEHEGLADLVSWLMGGKARITSDEFVTNLKCGIKEAGDDFNSEDKQMLKLYGKVRAQHSAAQLLNCLSVMCAAAVHRPSTWAHQGPYAVVSGPA